MSSPRPYDGPLRQVVRGVLVCVALWLIVSGVREQWPTAGNVLIVVLSVAVLVGLCVAGVVLLRRRRDQAPPP